MSDVVDILTSCSEYGIDLVKQMEQGLFDYGLYSTETSHYSNPGLIKMESSLLDIGANDSVVQGLFYMVPVFYQGKLFIR